MYNIVRNSKTTNVTYLEPLSVGLHLKHHTWVWFGQRVPVRDAFAGHMQLYFRQAWAVEEAQCVGS